MDIKNKTVTGNFKTTVLRMKQPCQDDIFLWCHFSQEIVQENISSEIQIVANFIPIIIIIIINYNHQDVLIMAV